MEYNCWRCFSCGKVFDRPYESYTIANGKKYMTEQYCPFCNSDIIDRDYDEGLEQIKRDRYEDDRYEEYRTAGEWLYA